MKKVVFILACTVLAWVLTVPKSYPQSQGDGDLFDPVYNIMDRPTGMGCRGCHIGPEPASGPYWGNNKDEVLQALESSDVLLGGRDGSLGYLVRTGAMPLTGERWGQTELDLLDAWLITYESE